MSILRILELVDSGIINLPRSSIEEMDKKPGDPDPVEEDEDGKPPF